MLILVGVTINLAANGGLFEKSRTASKDTEQKKILEELIAMAEFNNDGKIDVNSLTEKVRAKYDGSIYDQTNSKLTVKGNKGEFYYKVTETEISLWKENTTPTAKITAENYGDKVAYSAGGVDDWKIFYKDDNYVYIITSDNIKHENLPENLNNVTKVTYDSYSVYFTFSDSEEINISQDVANKYGLSWINKNPNLTTFTAKATSVLLDVSAWTTKFGNASKGIEAIGGPTLEMWVKSWNEKSTIKLKTEYNETGYYVGLESTESLSYSVRVSADTDLHKAGSLYFPRVDGNSTGDGYWLASPSYCESQVEQVHFYSGSVGGYYYMPYRESIRPLVSIPSSLIGEKDESGAWTVNLD